MKLLIPPAITCISLSDILKGFIFSFNHPIVSFESVIKAYTSKQHCYFTNSGTTAFYIILKALKRLSKKTEVILPAYTDPSLILPIKKTGLKPILCDISLKTFTMDIQSITKWINKNTLCIAPVHMFGLPVDMKAVMKIAQHHSLFVVENAASSLGSTIHGRPTGTFGDISFYSFNQGKNLSILSGGCIVTDQKELAEAIEKEYNSLPKPGLFLRLKISTKLIASAFAVRPLLYTIFYDLLFKSKYAALRTDFDNFAYTNFQAGIGCSLFGRSSKIFNKRYDHGMFLFDMLTGQKGIRLPELTAHAVPVFNQFPVLFDNENVKKIILKKFNEAGIESMRPYPNPIHMVYNLDYDLAKDPFPNATSFSNLVLLIPTHPMMDIEKLSMLINIIKGGLDECMGVPICPTQL